MSVALNTLTDRDNSLARRQHRTKAVSSHPPEATSGGQDLGVIFSSCQEIEAVCRSRLYRDLRVAENHYNDRSHVDQSLSGVLAKDTLVDVT